MDEHDGLVLTQETNCFETADFRPVLFAEAAAYTPAPYTVVPIANPGPPAWIGPSDALLAQSFFNDYVCEGVSVNGHQARPTIVSIGGVRVRRDNVVTSYLLWIGTDNPLLFARLQQLGVNALFIPQSTYAEGLDADGRRQITVEYVARGPGGLDYRRVITVVSAPTPAPTASIGTFYHLGSRGEVRFRYANMLDAAARAGVCFDLADGSLPLEYGITDFASGCFPTLRTFWRGSWQGTIELLP